MNFTRPQRWRRAFLLAAAVLCVATAGCLQKNERAEAAPRVAAKDTIAIGVYNVENLFDLHYDGTEYPEYRPGALGWNKQTWEKKVENIAAVIAALDVDVIGLCEVENRSALERLRRELRDRGKDFAHAAVAGRSGRGATRTALLSRFPIVASQAFGGDDERAGLRDILEADIDCGGAPLKIFVNHWPSQKHPESSRLAAARALAERIRQLSPQTDYVIVGDLNADYDEWRKFRTNRLDDTRGITGINHLLKTVHGGPDRPVSFVVGQEMESADRALHYNPWLELPEDRRRSYTYQGRPKTPDHILLPRSLFDREGWSYLEGSFTVFTMNDSLLVNGEPFRWRMNGFGKRRFHAGAGYSDHLPLRVTLIKRPASGLCCASDGRHVPGGAHRSGGDGGFEMSMEGWLSCGRDVAVARDSSMPAAGRYSLKIKVAAREKNSCAARTVLRRDPVNRPRRENITMDIRGSGKLSLRARTGEGRWRYYNAPAFVPAGSARYLPVALASWRHVVLPFTYDNTASADITVEIRAGKGQEFCVWVDNVAVR